MVDRPTLSNAGTPEPGGLKADPVGLRRDGNANARDGESAARSGRRRAICPRKSCLLFLFVLLFAFGGQYYFARLPDYLWDGITLYVVSIICLVLLVRTIEVGSEFKESPAANSLWGILIDFVEREPLRAGLYSVAIFGSLWIIQRTRSLPDGADHYSVMVVWAVSIFTLVAAPSLPGHLPNPGRWLTGIRASKAMMLEVAVLVSLLVAALLLRGLFVGSLPANFGGDEGSQGLSAVAILEGRSKDIFGVGWFTVPNLFFFFQAVSLRIFGDSVFGLRMLSVVLGTMAVGFCYLLVRRLFGITLAIAATVIFASYHFQIHYSRLGSAQVGDSLFIVAILFLLLQGMESGRAGWFSAAGVFLGLTQYFYFGARLVPVLVTVYLLYLAVVDRASLARRKGNLAMMALVALVVALPYLTFCTVHPEVYMARTNQVGIFQSGWYTRELALGRSPVAVLTEQALRSILAFNYYPDKVYWYHPGIPLLDFFSAVFFVPGLAYATWRMRQRRYFILASSYWLALFFGAFLTENPPSSMRLVILSPIVSILVTVGMVKVSGWARQILSFSPRSETILLMSLVGVAAIVSVAFYFGDYSKQRTEGYGGPNTEVATEMAWYLRDLGDDYRVYFFGAPRMYLDFATIPFIDRGIRGVDVKDPLNGPPTFVDPSYRSVFVFLPERLGELSTIKAFLPGGVEEEKRGEDRGQLLFVSYRFPQ